MRIRIRLEPSSGPHTTPALHADFRQHADAISRFLRTHDAGAVIAEDWTLRTVDVEVDPAFLVPLVSVAGIASWEEIHG